MPPTIEITKPQGPPNNQFKQNVAIEFEGRANDDKALQDSNIVWTENGNEFGRGRKITISANIFSTGSHTILATITDSDGVTATNDITIVIQAAEQPNKAPFIETIHSPLATSTYTENDNIEFRATGTDDKPLNNNNYIWNIDNGAEIRNNGFRRQLSSGQHTIRLRIQDSDGVFSNQKEVRINVNAVDNGGGSDVDRGND